jgi:HAD-hyrolase-like
MAHRRGDQWPHAPTGRTATTGGRVLRIGGTWNRKARSRDLSQTIRRCATSPFASEVRALWMVGDAPLPDIGGGRSVGLGTVWMDRGRAWDVGHGPAPDAIAGSVNEAVNHILDGGIVN